MIFGVQVRRIQNHHPRQPQRWKDLSHSQMGRTSFFHSPSSVHSFSFAILTLAFCGSATAQEGKFDEEGAENVDSKTKSVMLGNKEVKLTVVWPTKCCVVCSLLYSFINLESIPLLANSIRPTLPARSGSGLSLPRTTVTLMRSSLFSISPTKVRGFRYCINFKRGGELINSTLICLLSRFLHGCARLGGGGPALRR